MAHPCSEEQSAVPDIGMMICAGSRVVESLHNLVLMYTDSLNSKVLSDKMYRSSSAWLLKSEFEWPTTGRSTPNVNFGGLL